MIEAKEYLELRAFALNSIADGYLKSRTDFLLVDDSKNFVRRSKVEMVFADHPHSAIILALTYDGEVYRQYIMSLSNNFKWEQTSLYHSRDEAIESIENFAREMKRIV